MKSIELREKRKKRREELEVVTMSYLIDCSFYEVCIPEALLLRSCVYSNLWLSFLISHEHKFVVCVLLDWKPRLFLWGKETGQVTINDSSQRNAWNVVCARMRGRYLNHNYDIALILFEYYF